MQGAHSMNHPPEDSATEISVWSYLAAITWVLGDHVYEIHVCTADCHGVVFIVEMHSYTSLFEFKMDTCVSFTKSELSDTVSHNVITEYFPHMRVWSAEKLFTSVVLALMAFDSWTAWSNWVQWSMKALVGSNLRPGYSGRLWPIHV